MKRIVLLLSIVTLLLSPIIMGQPSDLSAQSSLYDVPPRWLIDMPTAGTLPRAYFDVGCRIYPAGGTIMSTDIGLSNRLMLGIAFGGEGVLSSVEPNWNPRIEFNVKLRIIDEQEYFPAVTLGFASQGSGRWNRDWQRYAFKSPGMYAVVSRSFYFYNWTSGWHVGMNYTMENKVDEEKDINFFGGWDATFKYNLALQAEYDAAINDNRSTIPSSLADTTSTGQSNLFAGKGRGYLNLGLKWLFTENLELELLLKDLLVNRRDSDTFTREIRITYIDRF
ncbi:MAG: hypothetical protein ABIE70_05625 [bacterium]